MEKETSTLTIIIDLREYNVRPKRPAQFSFSVQINDCGKQYDKCTYNGASNGGCCDEYTCQKRCTPLGCSSFCYKARD